MTVQLPEGFSWVSKADQSQDPASTGIARPPAPDGFTWTDNTPAEAPSFTGSFARGLKRTIPETKGLLAGAGAAVAGAVGADGIRDSLLSTYQDIQSTQVEPLANQSGFIDSVTGNGSLKEWAGDTLGNFAGQALQSVAAGAAGAAIGSVVPGAGTVAGGIGGIVAKAGAKELVEGAVARMVGKGVAEEVARKQVLAQLGGAAAATTGLNVGQEVGIGFTGRAEDAKAAGQDLTQQDALRAIGWGVPAGLVDTAAEALTGKLVGGGISTAPEMLTRAAKGAGVGAVTEGSTEGIQAVMERAGAGQEITGEQAYKDYIENVAAGALGGAVPGAAGGLRRQQPDTPPPSTMQTPPPAVKAPDPGIPDPTIQTPPAGPLVRAAQTLSTPPAATPPAAVQEAGNVNAAPVDANAQPVAQAGAPVAPAGQGSAQPNPVFDQALQLLAKAGKVSAGDLGKKLRLSKDQTVALMDELQARGVVSGKDSRGQRRLLTDPSTGELIDPKAADAATKRAEDKAREKQLAEFVRTNDPSVLDAGATAQPAPTSATAQTTDPAAFQAKMEERRAAALTRAQRPDPAAGAVSTAAATAFDTGASDLVQAQQAAEAEQAAQPKPGEQQRAQREQLNQVKLDRQAQALDAQAFDEQDLRALIEADIDAGKKIDSPRIMRLAKQANVRPRVVDDLRRAVLKERSGADRTAITEQPIDAEFTDVTGQDAPAMKALPAPTPTVTPKVAARLLPFSSEAAAKASADRLTAQKGRPYAVMPHPSAQGKWAVAPQPKAPLALPAPTEQASSQAPAPIAGQQIDKKWTAFAPESGTLGIPRAQMPQIKAPHRGALVNFLNARGIGHESEQVPATDLKPTQAEFAPGKVEKAAKHLQDSDRSILVSQDNHVLDGHHQWLAARNAGLPVNIIRLHAPIAELLATAEQFPSSVTAAGSATVAAAQTATEPTNQEQGNGEGKGQGQDGRRRQGRREALLNQEAGSADPQGSAVATPQEAYDTAPELLDTDITPPSGSPWTIRSAAEGAAKRTPGGKVFEVDGGFVVRVPRAVVNQELTTAPDPAAAVYAAKDRDSYVSAVHTLVQSLPDGSTVTDEDTGVTYAVKHSTNEKTGARYVEFGVVGGKGENDVTFTTKADGSVKVSGDVYFPGKGKATIVPAAATGKESLQVDPATVKESLTVQPAAAPAAVKAKGDDRPVLGNIDVGTLTKAEDAVWEQVRLTPERATITLGELKRRAAATGETAAPTKPNQTAQEPTNAEQTQRTEQAPAPRKAAEEAKPEAVLSDKAPPPSGTMQRQRMPRGDAVAEVQRQLKVTKKRATEIVNEIRSEAKNLNGDTYNLKPGIVQTADVRAAIERERAAAAAPAKPEAPLTVGDQATAAIPAVKRRLREARNRGDAKAEAEIERELQQLRAKVWDESPLPKPEDAPAPAQQALQESEWDQIVSTHKLRLQQEHGIASRTAGNPVSWQYMKEPQRAKLAADVRAIIANGGIDPQVDGTPAPAKPEKGIVGRRADGVMIREDERGVRWYAQGGVRIFETVSMRPTRQGMQIDRGVLQREFMTAEESAAAAKAAAPTEQPKAKPAPSANTIVTDADAEAARARLKAKFTRLNSGIDPEMMLDGITLGMYHIERGARTFAAYAKAMVDDLGDAVKPYLKSWYMGVKYDPRAAGFDGMDSAASVESAVVDSAPEPEQDSVTEDSTDAAPKPVEPSVRGGDPKGVPVAEGRRERPSQPGNAPPDTGDVAPAQSGDVAKPGAQQSGSAAGVRSPAKDVAGEQESQGSGNAGTGRKGAGRKKSPDAGAGSTRGADRPGVTKPETVSPANPGPGNFHIANPLEVVGGGQVARFNKNKAAIELFVALRDEGRRPTREEQEVLAGYTGWGSFGQDLFQGSWAYPQPKQGWEQRDQWLRDHLGRSDWEGLQRSITNAHYTDPPTVMAMWEMVRRMGFKGGRVLEPGMGIGNFFGMMPLDLKERSKLAGIELDPVTGGMAQMLYPDATVKVMGYQDSKTPDDFYDLVIGNWPFENTPVADRRYNRLNPMLHDYFFLKTLDQVRPGGIVIGITSAGSMDKKGTVVRRELAKKAELLASFRLPSGAFEDYAGTKVVTDIIVLRKRPEPVSNVDGEAWVDTVDMDTPAGEKVRVNAYYQKNPQNVVGTIDYGHGTTTFRPGMIVHRPDDMQAQLDRIVSMVPEGAYLSATRQDAVSYIANHTSDREGALTRTDAGLFIVRGEHLAPAHEVLKYQVKSQKDTAAREAQLNALIDMRKSYGQLIEAERGTSGAAPDPIRTQLRERYEAFVKAYGPMSESFGLGYLERIDDPFYYALAALETKDGNTYRPAAILSQSTIRSAKRITNPSIRDAFVLARNGNVNPSLDEIAKIAQKPEAMVRAELVDSGAVFETPGGDIVPSDMYLSGNVRETLRQAKVALADGNDGMQRNVAALEKVQPADIPYFNIEVQMGATWVPTRAYEQFVAHMLNRGDTDGISANYTMGLWKVTVDPSLQRSTEAQTGFGTRYYRFGKLVNAAISNQTVVIKERDRDGREFVDQTATDETNAKIADMREKFGDWLWSDAERRIEIEREYNEVRNAYASPSFDGSFLNFNGMALSVGRGPFDLRQHQVNAIWRALVMRRSLNAHEVGTGKTFTMGGIAVESRRYGIAKKPVLLAHNANSKSVASEIQMMYPAAKVLYIDNLSPKAIDVRLRQIANDDWDLIVLPHSLIERLSFREETLMAMAREEIEALEAEARLAAGDDGQNFTDAMLDDPDELKKLRSPTAKELVKARARIIETIKKQAQQSSREGAVPFEDLGIDMVLVDEAHEFKKPPIATRMKMKGLQTQSSLGSIQLSFLTRYVREQNNGGNVHLFTGTPITNTLTEIFHQMRYIMADEMAAVGVDQWDGWFGSFAKEVQDVELTAAGDYEAVNRLRGFINVPELRKMVGQYMDVVFSDDMPEMQPRRTASGKLLADQSLTERERSELLNGRTEGAKDRPYKKVVNETADPTPDQMRIFEGVQSLANEWRNMGGKARRDAMSAGLPVVPIVYEQLAARASFDARMENDEALAGKEGSVPDHPDSKVSRAIRNLLEIYRSDTRATQVVFTNTGLGTTANRALRDGAGGTIKDADGVTLRRQVKVFSPIKDMVERLVQQGVPRSEIEIVDGSTSKDRRKEIADAMNAGTVRIVIGSTQSLGVGVNMQRNLRAMHHLDAPWMPGDLEQRNGRGHRQGNQWNTVMEYRYITDRIDGRRWQVLAIKQKFITDFLKADGDTRVIEGDAASDEESDIISTFAEAAGDPRVLIRQKLVAQVEQLQKRERLHTQGVADAKSTARNARDGLARQRAEIDRIEKSGAQEMAAKAVADHAGDKFRITVDGVEISERKEANEAIGKFIGANMRTGADPMRIGSYGGLPLHVAWPRFYEAPVFVAVVAGEEVATGAASVASLESSLRAYTGTVDKLRARIQPALETIQRLDEVAGQKFQRADQLKRAEQQLLNLEKDIQLNPVPPPAWLRNGAAIDTDVRWNGTAFVVTGHRWNGAGWFVIAQDAKGGEVVIPYLDAKDAQGMPLYEQREFKAPIVHAKKDEAPKDGTGPTLETVVQTNVSNAEPAPPGQPAAGIESTPARTVVGSRPYFRNFGGDVVHEPNAKKIELSEMPDGEFYIAPGLARDSGQFEIMEATTGLRVGLGKTRKAAIEAANKAIVENRATIKTALEQRAFPKDKLDAAIAKLDGGNRASFAKADKPNAPGARGMPEKNLTRLLATAKQAMALLGVNIEVVANGSDLPAEITAQDDYDDTVQAAITGDRKTVYFVASRIASPRAAIKLVAHELVGHMSMEQLLGKRWPELRDAILRLRDNGKWPEVFAEVSKRYERNADGTFRPLDDATFAAEAIAVFAERNIQTSILQRAVNSVRAWLRRLGFAMDMSQGELRQMLWEAGQKLEGRAYRAAVVDDVLVKADENTRRMYVHEVAVKEKLQQSVFKTGAVAAEAGKLAGTDAGAIRSVLQGIYAVNPDTVSKVIDQTTGEPLAANFAKAQPAPDDKAAFAKAGTLVDRLGTQMNPHGDPSVLDWIKNRLSAMRPAALGALTLRMLGEVAEKILPSVARYSGVVQLMDTMRKELQELGQDVVKASMDYQAKNSAEAREMFSMLHDATLEGVDPSQRQVAEMPDGTRKFIDDATPKQIEKLKDAGATIKRGQFHEPLMMVSEDYKTNVPVTEASVKAFIKVMRKQMKLNPGSAVAYMNREKEARKLRAQERKRIKSHMDMVPRFNALSDDGKKLWGQMRDAYRTQSNKYLEALLSRIDSLNLDKSKKAEQIARMRMKFESSRVPFYVPLARWGNYWVSGTNDKGKREFYMQESPTAQDEVIRDLTARGFTKIGKGVKLDTVRAQDGASATFMADIDDMLVKSGAPDKIRDEAFQLYLAALPDLSMRKAFIHRKGTRGYSEDAPRALAAHIFHGSFQIARLRYSHELEALRVEAEKESKAMSDEAHEEAVAAGHIVNELKKRHEWVMNPQDNALVNKISSLGFVYYLGLTPASALVNLLATPMVALPILAATGNWASASKHLWRAFKESAGSYGHMEKVLTNEDEIAAHKEFERRGVLDRSQVHNLAGIAESDSFAYSPKWHKTMTIISHMFHKAEVVNREATTMASYRMQREAGIGHEEAMNLAEQQTYEAHLDYSNANRARFMQSGTAKVLLMFRQYSLGMTWLIGRNLWKSDLLGGALGGKTDKAELREARRKVAGILGMTAIFSGTLGLPIIGTVGAVLNAVAAAFGDDDEPWDWETEFRAFLREMLGETGAEAVLRGPVQAATGVGISNRVSMGDLWFREPDRELEGRAWSNYLFEQAAGPMGGMITNFFRGQQLMAEGQMWRGVETMMPKALRDGMKSIRYLDEGVNNLRGDAIIEDLNVLESLAQIAGFSPASVSQAYDTARDIKNYEQAILSRRSRLMDAFALAWRLGDTDAREAVLVKMRKFSQTYPELAITGESIKRSLTARARASAQADGGVIVDKRIRARLEAQLG